MNHRDWPLIVGLLAWVGFIVILMAWVDRPVAQAMHALPWAPDCERLTHLVDPLVPLASAIVVLASFALLYGWRPGPNTAGLLWMAFAVLAAAAIKEELKYAFGRTWPETWTNANPSYIHDGVFSFAPFHGGKGWASFPSGHMSVSVAAVAASWSTFRRCRWIGAFLALLVAIGLLGANFHWLSDIAGGSLLGVMVGAGVARLGNPLGWHRR